ncbi:MAG: cation:proton antiporter [Ruminococcaceae bacterium]|nr:cation:proton antiporter [Oscillospiraceae bacterium]
MLDKIYSSLNGGDLSSGSGSAVVIISVAAMIFLAFAMTRITKKLKLPNVTAYIITGVLIGPFFLDLVPERVVVGMDFLADIALAFIAFNVGEFFIVSKLKESGLKVVLITLAEAAAASILVFVVTFFVLKVDLPFSVVLSALAAATAPASTMMTIRQTGARGDFVDTLLQVIALDNVVSLTAYSVAISFASASISEITRGFDITLVIYPVIKNLIGIAVGALLGVLLKLLTTQKRSNDNRLIIAVGILFLFCGICSILDVSPLLGCMMIGAVYINLTDDHRLFLQLNYFNPPILLLFFVRSGLTFRLDAFTGGSASVGSSPLWLICAVYFVVRIIGKYGGAFVGSWIAGKGLAVRKYLGLALIPQAGVAIGLAAMGARTLGGEVGEILNTIILATSILYEIIGPVCAKLSLYLSGSYSDNLDEIVPAEKTDADGRERSGAEILIEQIRRIQEELPKRDEISPEEKAFNEAAEEQLEVWISPRNRFRRR